MRGEIGEKEIEKRVQEQGTHAGYVLSMSLGFTALILKHRFSASLILKGHVCI